MLSANSAVLRRLRARARPAADATAEPAIEQPTERPVPPAADSGGPTQVQHPPRPVIFGRVGTGAHEALSEATLTLTDLSGRQLDRDSSDSGGHYRLRPPAGGSYLVICASPAHQPVAALVAVAEASVRHDVVLAGAGASMSGSVSTVETGEAIGNAMVTLVDVHGDVVASAVTEDDGYFTFVELPAGFYTLTVAATALQPVARSVELPAAGHVTHNVQLVSRVTLVGVVRTATTGVPVPEALTTLIAMDGQVVGSVLTDAGGGFVFDDLAAGTYTVIASGYPAVATEVNLGPMAPTKTVITLWPTTVSLPTGSPAGVAHSGPGAGTDMGAGTDVGAGTDTAADYRAAGTDREGDAHGID